MSRRLPSALRAINWPFVAIAAFDAAFYLGALWGLGQLWGHG